MRSRTKVHFVGHPPPELHVAAVLDLLAVTGEPGKVYCPIASLLTIGLLLFVTSVIVNYVARLIIARLTPKGIQ